MIRVTSLAPAVVLVACRSAADTDVEPIEPAPLAEPSGGACPQLVDGVVTLESAGKERTVRVLRPDVLDGAPIVLAWHASGSSADEIVDQLGLEGLWTTWLAIHRGDSLATAAVFSGGTGALVTYSTPAWPLPVLLVWGGEDDLWGGSGLSVSLDDAMIAFGDALEADGHVVERVVHDEGHAVPPDAPERLRAWVAQRRFGEP